MSKVYSSYICSPGTGHLTETQAAEPCRCRHPRGYHWFGGGECGECSRCTYFRPRPPAREPSG